MEVFCFLILECLFACLKDKEAFQISYFIGNASLSLKQANKHSKTKKQTIFIFYLSNPKSKSENRILFC